MRVWLQSESDPEWYPYDVSPTTDLKKVSLEVNMQLNAGDLEYASDQTNNYHLVKDAYIDGVRYGIFRPFRGEADCIAISETKPSLKVWTNG